MVRIVCEDSGMRATMGSRISTSANILLEEVFGSPGAAHRKSESAGQHEHHVEQAQDYIAHYVIRRAFVGIGRRQVKVPANLVLRRPIGRCSACPS